MSYIKDHILNSRAKLNKLTNLKTNKNAKIYIQTVTFQDADDNRQDIEIYQDNELNASFGLDLSYMCQIDSFQHPYADEIISFEDYSECF